MDEVRNIPLSQDAALVLALAGTPPRGDGVVDQVCRRAKQFAAARDAPSVGTVDLLFAVMDQYDRLFDRALYLRGTSRDELLERLAAVEKPAG